MGGFKQYGGFCANIYYFFDSILLTGGWKNVWSASSMSSYKKSLVFQFKFNLWCWLFYPLLDRIPNKPSRETRQLAQHLFSAFESKTPVNEQKSRIICPLKNRVNLSSRTSYLLQKLWMLTTIKPIYDLFYSLGYRQHPHPKQKHCQIIPQRYWIVVNRIQWHLLVTYVSISNIFMVTIEWKYTQFQPSIEMCTICLNIHKKYPIKKYTYHWYKECIFP